MDDRSTPIESLNNNSADDSEVVNNILSKYNNLESSDSNIEHMENKFENRNLSQEIYNLNSNNVAYEQHYKKELDRTKRMQNDDDDDVEDYQDEYEDEYEIIEVPLWRRVLNEIRIPLFIFIFIVIFSNCGFDKMLIKKLPIFGNPYNECNTYGFLFKACLISILSYLLIKFVRI